ncbi:MAG: PilZ domain-containing protein [Pyrinomonadaceae bacterium]|nr:PilZ domain-containing protein [Pyrinomonadaceae bacterium]
MQATTSLKSLRPVERRSEPRICGPFPAIVLNAGTCQKRLGVRTVLDNFSASGCYLRLTRRVKQDDSLLLITQISGAVIVIRGVVLRVKQCKDSTYGIAVSISQHQIFSLDKFQVRDPL